MSEAHSALRSFCFGLLPNALHPAQNTSAAELHGVPHVVNPAREIKPAKTMIVETLNKKLDQMKLGLQQRNQWPIGATPGIDPFADNVWGQFLDSPHSWVPVLTDALPELSITPDDELHELLAAPAEVFFHWGCARPHLLWLQKIGESEKRTPIPDPSSCTPFDYLELEELIHSFSSLEAMLLQNN